MRLLHVAATLALLLAGMSASGHGPDGTGAQPRCIHDEVVARQLGGQTLAEALSRGRFRASAVVAGPEAGVARAAGDAAYQPIRIKVYTEDVYNTSKYCTAVGENRSTIVDGTIACGEDNILTAEMQTQLVQVMIPEAVKMHAERLSVQPLSHLGVPPMPEGTICESFTVPEDVLNNGINDTDFVLFVAAAPVTGSTVAWATTCGFAEGSDRPIIGVINVKPEYIDGSDQSVRTMAHEIAHSLGFSGYFFQTFNMSQTAANVRGKPPVPVVASPRVVQRAGNHFGCDKIVGMELDDTGGAGTAGSHWNLRNGLHDLMCGYVGPMMRYSAITIAAMEDTGFYKGNYDKAEGMSWGYQQGCALLDEKCVNRGETKFPSMFCTRGNELVCTGDRTAVAPCLFGKFYDDVPSYFRAYANSTVSGPADFDYCPVALEAGSVTNCTGSARCMDAARDSSLPVPLCAEFECDAAAGTYRVKFQGSTTFVTCPEGMVVVPADSSPTEYTPGIRVVCPPVTSVCPFVFNSLALNVTLNLVTPTNNTDGGGGGGGTNGAEALPSSRAAVLAAGALMVLLAV